MQICEAVVYSQYARDDEYFSEKKETRLEKYFCLDKSIIKFRRKVGGHRPTTKSYPLFHPN